MWGAWSTTECAVTLENLILNLTANTPSGGLCQIGDACFRVWYCTDIWEWEYQGGTYWDPLDLARAILASGALLASRLGPQVDPEEPGPARVVLRKVRKGLARFKQSIKVSRRTGET